MNKFIDSVLNILLAVGTILTAAMLLGIVYLNNFTQFARNSKTEEIYKKILAATGQAQNAVPLQIVISNEENAYTDGTKVVIYTALINNADSWDEVAMVLAHEVAHVNLGHISETPPVIMHVGMGQNAIIEQLEANADKMGAVYMMKAGYDVCKGREVFHRWQQQQGNSLGDTHPNFSYRFDELNINCGRN